MVLIKCLLLQLRYSRSIGYALNLDGRSCADVDECKENPRICNGGKCKNTPGGYVCNCTNGLLPGRDGVSCIGKFFISTVAGSILKSRVHERYTFIRCRRMHNAATNMRARRVLQHDRLLQLSLRGRILGETSGRTGVHR